jgi:hypothetical protein
MSASAWKHVGGAMGIPFVIAYVLLFALTGNSPDDTSSDQKILDYYGSHSHRVKEITMFFVLAVALILLIWFLGHMHGMLSSTESGGGLAASIAGVSGGLFIALFTVSGCTFIAVPAVISSAGDKFTLDPNTFRLLAVVGFLAYMAAFTLGSALAFAVGVVAWRTGVLPRWLAVASFVGGLAGLVSGFFYPSIAYVAWILILSVYLAFRPAGAAQAQPAPPAPAAATQ